MSTRTRLSSEASEILKALEKRTKLTPNLLARLALTLSLEDKGPFSDADTGHSGLEFNHSTLYGQHEQIYRQLAIQWAKSRKDTDRVLRQHIERGVFILRDFLATRSLADLAVGEPTSRATRRPKTVAGR